MKRIYTIKVRLSDREQRRIKFRAKQAGLTDAGYVRSQALGNEVTESIDRKLASETISGLNKVGNLLNQIAAKLNTGKIVDSATVNVALEELNRRIEDIRMAMKAIADDIGDRHDW